jgi:C4-dicarboxylate-specific signal transduction histidine kinase
VTSELHTPLPEDTAQLCRALCHEVGNALAAVRLSAHLLTGEPEPGAVAAGARELEAVAARAGAVLGQLRALLAADPGPVSPSASPRAVLRAVRHAVAWAGGSPGLEVSALGALPSVVADGEALHHLLASLIFAAWDAAPDPAPVRLAAEAWDGGVALAVEDDGPSWRPSPQDPSAGPRGRALWLAVSATLAARWGGSVAVRSGDGGTRVELRLRAA